MNSKERDHEIDQGTPPQLFSAWLEPLNYAQVTSKAYYGHVPFPIHRILGYSKQNQIVQALLADRDILVREEASHHHHHPMRPKKAKSLWLIDRAF